MTSASLDTKAKSTGVKKTNKRILVPDRGAVGGTEWYNHRRIYDHLFWR